MWLKDTGFALPLPVDTFYIGLGVEELFVKPPAQCNPFEYTESITYEYTEFMTLEQTECIAL